MSLGWNVIIWVYVALEHKVYLINKWRFRRRVVWYMTDFNLIVMWCLLKCSGMREMWFNESKCINGKHGMIEYLVTVWTGYDICRRLDDKGRLRICRSRRRRRRWSICWFYARGWTVLSTRMAHIWYGRPDFLDVQCTSRAFISRWEIKGRAKYSYCIIGPWNSSHGRYWNCVRCSGIEDSPIRVRAGFVGVVRMNETGPYEGRWKETQRQWRLEIYKICVPW